MEFEEVNNAIVQVTPSVDLKIVTLRSIQTRRGYSAMQLNGETIICFLKIKTNEESPKGRNCL